jgi:hypothetical protein
MSKVRHPDNFDAAITTAVENATLAEVLIPMETMQRAKAFRQRIYDLIRAHREHKTDFSTRIPRISARIYTSMDVALNHVTWNPGPLFPYTIILDCRAEFSHNLANMELNTDPRTPISRTSREPVTHVAPPLADDTYEYNDEDGSRDSIFSDIMKGLNK